ncbi:hypothetical protein H632_c2951p0, partial [Helicosporidium sp. ATCC 50920]
SSDRVLDWTLENIYQQGDEIHFLHVIPVPMPAVVGGLGGLDTGLVTVNPDPQEDVKHIAEAKDFINRRFATKVATKNVPYKVEIVHFLTDNDSIGEAIVKRAEVLKAAVVIMAKHQRNALTEFFLGSVTKYVTHHLGQPLIILH